MASNELDDSVDMSTDGNTSLPPGIESDVATQENDGVNNALDSFFTYAKDTVDLGKAVGVIGGNSGQGAVNPNGTVQPTGANPVVQNKQTTTAQSWVKTHPGLAVAIGVGSLVGIYALYKLLK